MFPEGDFSRWCGSSSTCILVAELEPRVETDDRASWIHAVTANFSSTCPVLTTAFASWREFLSREPSDFWFQKRIALPISGVTAMPLFPHACGKKVSPPRVGELRYLEKEEYPGESVGMRTWDRDARTQARSGIAGEICTASAHAAMHIFGEVKDGYDGSAQIPPKSIR